MCSLIILVKGNGVGVRVTNSDYRGVKSERIWKGWKQMVRENGNTVESKVILVCSGCHNKMPLTGRLKQQKFIFSQY